MGMGTLNRIVKHFVNRCGVRKYEWLPYATSICRHLVTAYSNFRDTISEITNSKLLHKKLCRTLLTGMF